MKRLIQLGFLMCAAASPAAHATDDRSTSVAEKVALLKPGQYFWEDAAASPGPLLVVINVSTQRVLLFRDGVLVAASTISTGSEGRETPIGMFTILEKAVWHRSRTYDDAPMPYMQRLTWKGIAMHAGDLPGYPASHGCIRLPRGFAKLLYGVTELGTPVRITDEEQERLAAEYERAIAETAQKRAELVADAQRAMAEADRAKAAHEEAVRQHEARFLKDQSAVASN